MINEVALRQTLVLVFEHLKSARHQLSVSMTEIAALRDSLLDAGDHRFREFFDIHKAEQASRIAEVDGLREQLYDDLILQLKSGKGF